MTDMPVAVAEELRRMNAALDLVVPEKTATNLLIASWNVRGFGAVTPKWASMLSDSPKRDWRAVALMTAVVSRFDVVAVQEVRRDLAGLRFLLQMLGPSWRFVTSDVTEGSTGNGERLTFLFDTARVEPSGLVGEIVLPPAMEGEQSQQFARTPYAASFARGDVGFILTTVHILWGASASDRLPELTAFANWMRAWADRPRDFNENILVLGDFNIDRRDDPLHQAFSSTGLFPPPELDLVPRTIFDNDINRHFYDQIAWFTDVESPHPVNVLTSLRYAGRAGSFDFVPHAFAGLTKNELSWRLSDHYPLWVEFAV